MKGGEFILFSPSDGRRMALELLVVFCVLLWLSQVAQIAAKVVFNLLDRYSYYVYQ